MSRVFVPQVGAVFSADIAVPEHEREVRFYSRVLGTGQRPLWREDLMNNVGLPIIGLGPRRVEFEHLPLQWMPHIQVADVADSVQRALEKRDHTSYVRCGQQALTGIHGTGPRGDIVRYGYTYDLLTYADDHGSAMLVFPRCFCTFQ